MIYNIYNYNYAGWAGPANWVGLSPKGLGRSRPNSSLCFFRSRPDVAQT